MNKLAQQLSQVRLNKKKKGGKKAPNKNRGVKAVSKLVKCAKDHSGYFTSDSMSPIYGLMDSIPSVAVVNRGASSVTVSAGNQYVGLIGGCLGLMNNFVNLAPTDGNTDPDISPAVKAITAISATGNTAALNAHRIFGPKTTTSSLVTSAQYTQNPFTHDHSFLAKCNKISFTLSYSGTQALMSAEFRILIDLHGDLMGIHKGTGPTYLDIYNRIFNHPRSIKVKVDSGKSIQYVVPLPTAQLDQAEGRLEFMADSEEGYPITDRWVANDRVWVANSKAASDGRKATGGEWHGVRCFLYRKEGSSTTPSEEYGIMPTPLVYIVSNCTTAAAVALNVVMDNEYHDESLYPLQKPSSQDVQTASALHTVCSAAHHYASTKPLHSEGLTFKKVLGVATKAEHVVSTLANSPVAKGILAAGLALL